MRIVICREKLLFNVQKAPLWRIALFTVLVSVSGCKEEEGTTYDSGYGDGYAVGYNTECKIRATMISGKFDYPEYANGFADGEADGIADCRAGKSP